MVCISIQVAWGAYETLGAISYNIQANIIAYDPAPLGVFNQKNVFASFLVTGLGVSLYLNSFKENKFYEAIWYNSFALIAVFILIFSNSRVGYIGAVFSIILILPFALKQRRLYAFFWLVSAIIGLGAALYVLGDMGSVEKEMAKDGSRMGIYFTSLHSIIDAPIVGHGLGSFEGVFLEKYGDLHQKGMLPVGSSQGTITHPHNEFLYWGIQGGMISIIGIIVLIVSLLGSLPVKKQLVKWLASIALLVPITLHAMVEMPFYQSVLHLIVVIAIYVSVYHILNDKTEAVNVYEIKKCSLLLPVLPSLALGSLTVVFFMNITSLNTFHVFINQKERSLTLLEDIGVTIGWDKTYQHVYLATISQVGIQQSRPELSEPYIKWAEETISKSPKLDYFITLVYAYESTGQRDKALDAVRLFDYYYPTHKPAQDWISSYYSKVIGKTSPDR